MVEKIVESTFLDGEDKSPVVDAEIKKITSESHLIDVSNLEDLNYIAKKLGCSASDILEAVAELKSFKRSKIYTWLIDKSFKSQYNKWKFVSKAIDLVMVYIPGDAMY